MNDHEVDVLVVGAGLGGLSTAMFLARQGVRVLVVERRPGLSPYPRAAGQNPRTMELLRIGGVADEVVRADDIRGTQGDFVIRLAQSVRGEILRTVSESFDDMVSATEPCTPAGWAMLSQDKLEPILLAQARKHGGAIRFDTRLLSFRQHGDGDGAGVTARLAGPDGEYDLRAGYLVGADGNRSLVRESLGIGRYGHGTLTHMVGVIFDADLSGIMEPGTTGWYYLHHPEFKGTFGPTDRPDRHTLFVEYDPDQGERPEDFTPERCVELIGLALDAPEVKPELVDIQGWEMAARIAERWREGRVFLVGDAAKVTPPTGGMSGNAAVADGFDLAWKLAAVLQGQAGEGLLGTYEDERKVAAELVVAEALAIYAQRMAPHMAEVWDKSVGYPETLLGFRYRSSAVLATDDDEARVENPLTPSGRPGFRGPHVLVSRHGERLSTVELFGDGWTLLAGELGSDWVAAAETASAELGVPVRAYRIGAGLTDSENVVSERYGIGKAGASLVRPDGIVAWRTDEAAADTAATLEGVLRRVLDR
ncbi:FAD-dependent oxidoreductase [Streptomyces violarus]|uniref:Aklavinone 12-hydroxylase n=1 Tax=Streptomyces violarus TaxID=67380 RepID=A0A7W4ZTK2_9ACTN|nr:MULTISPECIES: FAD-dependent oxidoreductase [Streptomyces]MBB3078297.1 aklavinone 12-hydroxylase [Streptomyces violarus]WRT99556.1 FAD-dependent oxidoreductase [Streptomyces sp. CGMCC 4.1772]GHD20471.1 FAD-dependent oxidoreductase [Streptomyces violarus]